MENQFEIIVITFNTMFIPGIFWIGLEKILHSDKWNKFILTTTTALAVTGIIFISISVSDRFQLALAISFLFPIYHLLFYRGLRNFFIKNKKRDPVDVAFNFKSGLIADRVFSLFFVLFSIFSAGLIIGSLIANYTNNP